MSRADSNYDDTTSSVTTPLRGSPVLNNFNPSMQSNAANLDKNPVGQKISLDQIGSALLKQNFILTALEFHTELAETGRELPRLRDFFSNPANFEQQNSSYSNNPYSSYGSTARGGGESGFYPLRKASSIQTFDSLDLTRYSDDVGENKFDDKIAVLEFELRKANQTINQLRNTLTLATDTSGKTPNKDSDNSDDNKIRGRSIESDTHFSEEYQYIEIKNSDTQMTIKGNDDQTLTKAVMPHEKNVLNFLINEYLLEQNYKMTSVTFAEENESQDLEDWDSMGLNRPKPPNLCHIYKNFLRKNDDNFIKSQQVPLAPKELQEVGLQVDLSPELVTNSTNTEAVTIRSFETMVNFDHDAFEKQRMQIGKLLDKQEILMKSIASLEKEINKLNLERETNLKKIDLLTISLDESNTTIKSLQKDKIEYQTKLNENEYNKVNNIRQSEAEVPKLGVKEETPTEDANEVVVEVPRQRELNDRKIPVVFRDYLNKNSVVSFDRHNESLLKEISELKISRENLIELLFKYLPIIAYNVTVERRLDLLPLVLTSAVLEQEEGGQLPKKKDYHLLKLLFNLIEKPNEEQRAMILSACIQFTKFVGPMCVNNYLLPQCWEQINDKNEERRMLVAEACAILAPHIYTEMRSSLMFSILKEIIEQENCEAVKVCAAKSFAILINYINDPNKFNQCIEILDICTTDPSPLVVAQVENLMMPSLSLWALMIGKLNEPLMSHLVSRLEFYLLDKKQNHHAKTYLSLLRMNLQFVFASILLHFRNEAKVENGNGNGDATLDTSVEKERDYQLSKLNSYYHTLQEKMNINIDLYKLDSYLDDYLKLSKEYLLLIENDSWSSDELSNAFTWLNDKLLRKLIQMSAQVDSSDPLCPYFVSFFSDFVLLFIIDFELIKSEIIPIFEKLLNVPASELDDEQQNIFEQSLKNKSCPLYKATLPVYFVGILSTLVDAELNGWFGIIQDTKNAHMPTSSSMQLNGSNPETDATSSQNGEKRISHMNLYLKNVFFALSLNQTNLDGLVSIYKLMKLKSKQIKQSDYIIQMLIATLWDGIVHMSLYIRCNTAKLFEILVKDCDENLLSTRILPALITLANDLDKMVRCSSISPLTCIIENCQNKEILERVYTQLQSFLSDPILKDEYVLQIELLKTFRRISTKANVKFREEFILPYLTILTMQIKNAINDNDYEFPVSAFTVTFSKLATLSSSSVMSSSSSTLSQASTINHQQDLIKICTLLYDTYRKLVANETETLYISRQSLQESLLPGLVCLRDIFQNNVINLASSTPNEYVLQLDQVISTIEKLQHQSLLQESHTPKDINRIIGSNHSTPSAHSEINNAIPAATSTTSFSSASPMVGHSQLSMSATSMTNQAASTVGEIVTAGVSALAANSPITTSGIVVAGAEGAKFKSFFNGINSLKDSSKDKFSNFLLTNKSFKK